MSGRGVDAHPQPGVGAFARGSISRRPETGVVLLLLGGSTATRFGVLMHVQAGLLRGEAFGEAKVFAGHGRGGGFAHGGGFVVFLKGSSGCWQCSLLVLLRLLCNGLSARAKFGFDGVILGSPCILPLFFEPALVFAHFLHIPPSRGLTMTARSSGVGYIVLFVIRYLSRLIHVQLAHMYGSFRIIIRILITRPMVNLLVNMLIGVCCQSLIP